MSILQYLANYAEAEASVPPPSGKRYENVVVIPAFDERPSFVSHITERGTPQTLWIIVVNTTADRSEGELQRTRYLASALSAGSLPLAEGIGLRESAHGDIVVIDRACEGRELPERQGVGLARKIGCDVALAWHMQDIITSPWLHCTDADATLPRSYFEASKGYAHDDSVVGLCYPFWHDTEPTSQAGRALELYEMSLRYYVLGLRWAGSPYAFHTVGSSMAVRFASYLAVRGMPKRQAGEDFYLLGKVAKMGRIATPQCAPIRLAQRGSERTPFGTGPATKSILADMQAGKPFRVYNPRSFALVREWLEVLEEYAKSPNLALLETLSHAELRNALPLDTEKHLRLAKTQCKSRQARLARLMGWFDSFRTLKLIHALRDRGLEDVPWHDATDSAPFIPEPEEGEKLRKTLARVDVRGQ